MCNTGFCRLFEQLWPDAIPGISFSHTGVNENQIWFISQKVYCLNSDKHQLTKSETAFMDS